MGVEVFNISLTTSFYISYGGTYQKNKTVKNNYLFPCLCEPPPKPPFSSKIALYPSKTIVLVYSDVVLRHLIIFDAHLIYLNV